MLSEMFAKPSELTTPTLVLSQCVLGTPQCSAYQGIIIHYLISSLLRL